MEAALAMQVMWNWMVVRYQWPYAALSGACCLLAVSPVVGFRAPWMILVYLQLPVYMIHQFEEHADDRFRKALNAQLADGRDALTRAAAFWINSVLVWGPIMFALYAGIAWGSTWTLVGSYLLVINALVHLADAVRLRHYNPGLVTAVVLLFPLGLTSLIAARAPMARHVAAHAVSAGLVLVLHGAIIVHVLRRNRLLMASES